MFTSKGRSGAVGEAPSQHCCGFACVCRVSGAFLFSSLVPPSARLTRLACQTHMPPSAPVWSCLRSFRSSFISTNSTASDVSLPWRYPFRRVKLGRRCKLNTSLQMCTDGLRGRERLLVIFFCLAAFSELFLVFLRTFVTSAEKREQWLL